MNPGAEWSPDEPLGTEAFELGAPGAMAERSRARSTLLAGAGALGVGALAAECLVVMAVHGTATLLDPVHAAEPATLASINSASPSRGLALVDVDIAGDLGNLPAWLVAARPPDPSAEATHAASAAGTWVILVHGHGGDRADCLAASGTFDALGLSQLVVSWRNDGVAGRSVDSLYHLGDTEWRDLEAAAGWALDHGARRLILYGFSMGASIIGAFCGRSKLAGAAAAIVLDAPVLDWRAVLRHAAHRRGLPPSLARVTAWVAERRVGIDLDDLDVLRLPQGLGLPTLIFHGTQDQLVPPGTSRRYVERHPEAATLVEVAGAQHGETWLRDPQACQAALRRFMVSVLRGRVEP